MTHQKISSGAISELDAVALGRLPRRQPVAVIDIGSNSVRQVVYEGMTRALSVLFNEKVLCGLGHGVATTGAMESQAVDSALNAISRFVALGRHLGVVRTHVLATAAAREASNGPEFIKKVEALVGSPITVLTGEMEAEYAAWGVKCGFHKPSGFVGDLGGGSLELVNCNGEIENGISLPLGGLRLEDMSGGSLPAARDLVNQHLNNFNITERFRDEVFYAVGGTWRSLARLHLAQNKYPLHVLHDYRIDAADLLQFCQSVIDDQPADQSGISSVSKNRRGLLPYGAIVMSEILKATSVTTVVISSLGLREGYLHSLFDAEEQEKDPLLEASKELSQLRSRSPAHSIELADWTGDALATLGIDETENEKRYRIASCYLADIAWRAHSDYQAEQSLGIISNAGFVGIDHPGRAYLAVANYCRYSGLSSNNNLPQIARLAGERYVKRARVLAALMRVLYLFSASREGVLPSLQLQSKDDGTLVFIVPGKHADLAGERPAKRLQQLGNELGRPVSLQINV